MGKICDLIANKMTQFTEEDRPWLSVLTEEQLDRLVPVAPEPKVLSLDEALAAVGEADRTKIQAGIQANEDRRAALIQGITANQSNKLAPEALAAMPTETLEGIAALAVTLAAPKAPVNNAQQDTFMPAPLFFGGNFPKPTVNEETPLAAPTINLFAKAN